MQHAIICVMTRYNIHGLDADLRVRPLLRDLCSCSVDWTSCVDERWSGRWPVTSLSLSSFAPTTCHTSSLACCSFCTFNSLCRVCSKWSECWWSSSPSLDVQVACSMSHSLRWVLCSGDSWASDALRSPQACNIATPVMSPHGKCLHYSSLSDGVQP